METAAAADVRYPIGKFKPVEKLSYPERERLIGEIQEAPARLRSAVRGLSDAQLDTPYREGGWTVRQVVHHLADSHMNAFVRFKLAVTESQPVIKTYNQALWAETPDAKTAPIEPSLTLVDSLHQRWVVLLNSLDAPAFERTVQHPERGLMTLDQSLAIYAWHGRHHVGHITSLAARLGWN